jgi:hypothetical protein
MALASAFARASIDLAAAQGRAYGAARAFFEAYARLDGSPFAKAIGIRLGYQLSADEGTPLRRAAPPAVVAGAGAGAAAFARGLE